MQRSSNDIGKYDPAASRDAALRTELETRASDAVMAGTIWLAERDIYAALDARTGDAPENIVRIWLAEGKIFVISGTEEMLYPAYQFEPTGQPVSAIAQILKLFEGYILMRIAGWFESVNSMLAGRRPSEMISICLNQTVNAARDHMFGPTHG